MEWSLVQHSGFLVGQKSGFEKAVEVLGISTAAERKRVIEAGGLVFADYGVADDAEYEVCYPLGHDGGMYPRCLGTFSEKKLDGRPIYVPTPEERERHARTVAA